MPRVPSPVLLFTMAAAFSSAPALNVWAAEPAHEHGVGRLQVALEGNELEISLNVPGADAVGFEHAPKTDADHKAVDAAAHKLEELDHVLEVPAAAKCHIEKATVSSGLMEGGEHDHKDDHKDEHKGHDHGHKDDHKDEHKGHDHGHKDDHKDGEPHAEFLAEYHLHCDAPSKLDGLNVLFFKAFPSAHELKAQWITPKGQGAATLTAKATRLKF